MLDPKKSNTGSFEPKKTSPYLGYGIQELKINSVEVGTASTGSIKLIFNVESKPITEADFTPVEGATGRVGRVSTSYLKENSDQYQEEFDRLMTMATKAGIDIMQLPVYDNIQAAASDVVAKMKGKFLRFKVTAKYYWGDKDGTPVERYNLAFARFKFVESLNEESTLTFDPANKYDIDKRLLVLPETQDTNTQGGEKNDLPF